MWATWARQWQTPNMLFFMQTFPSFVVMLALITSVMQSLEKPVPHQGQIKQWSLRSMVLASMGCCQMTGSDWRLWDSVEQLYNILGHRALRVTNFNQFPLASTSETQRWFKHRLQCHFTLFQSTRRWCAAGMFRVHCWPDSQQSSRDIWSFFKNA